MYASNGRRQWRCGTTSEDVHEAPAGRVRWGPPTIIVAARQYQHFTNVEHPKRCPLAPGTPPVVSRCRFPPIRCRLPRSPAQARIARSADDIGNRKGNCERRWPWRSDPRQAHSPGVTSGSCRGCALGAGSGQESGATGGRNAFGWETERNARLVCHLAQSGGCVPHAWEPRVP